MKLLCAALFLLWELSASGFSPEGTWLQQDVQWKEVPAEEGKAQGGTGTLIYFASDHSLGIINGWLTRAATRLSISNGDPRQVYKGTWSVDGKTIVLRTRLVETTILQKGGAPPGPMLSQQAAILNQRRLRFQKHTFRPCSSLNKAAGEIIFGVGGIR